MKLVLALMMIMGIAICLPVLASGEVKEVCTPKVDKTGKPVNDKKTGKQAEDCKNQSSQESRRRESSRTY